ncbi:MAG: hypothetical protein KDC39_12615 [Actinobacteria bacterium]|nr:hypothetical protein [Actinomycetota bacterium]
MGRLLAPLSSRSLSYRRRALASGLAMALAPAALVGCASGNESDEAEPTPLPSSPSTSSSAGSGLALDLTTDGLNVGPLSEGARIPNRGDRFLSGTVTYPTDAESPRIVVEHDGAGTGTHLTFPDPCSSGPDCRRGIVEVASSDVLNPGDADFQYGAEVNLLAENIKDGANVVQKGYSTGGVGQWKLQIDDKAGRPSCVLVSTDDTADVLLAETGVADGVWHTIICRRIGDTLELWIDGRRDAVRDTVPHTISTDTPVRIAGKSTKENGDAFFGSIRRVFYGSVDQQTP